MKTLHLQPTVPHYMRTFRCIGADCPENCCHGWRIDIDEQTYKKYQKVAIYPLAKKLQTVLQPSAQPSRSTYAVMQMQEDGRCAMLDQDSLCEIHAKLGSDHLSDTCMHYPRVFSSVHDKLYCFSTLSCPAAADLALRQPDSMTMAVMDMSMPGKAEIPLENILDFKQHPHIALEFLEPIQEVAALVVRHPELSAAEAMVVLSLMVQKLARHFAEPDPAAARAALARTLTDFCRPAYCLEARDVMAQAPRQLSARLTLLKGITLKYLQERKGRPTFMETLAQAARGLHLDAADQAEAEQSCLIAERDWFEPFDRRHPHLLKNYLLNEFGKNNFPVGKSLNIEAEFTSLAVRFALIRLYLIGIAGDRREAFDEQDYVRLVYRFVRNLEHGSFFVDTLNAMAQQGYGGLAAAVILLR